MVLEVSDGLKTPVKPDQVTPDEFVNAAFKVKLGLFVQTLTSLPKFTVGIFLLMVYITESLTGKQTLLFVDVM